MLNRKRYDCQRHLKQSSNLIHGGLRYLENYDFKLVRDTLIEQAIWQQRTPTLVKPLKFVLPHEKHSARAGCSILTWLYDHQQQKNIALRALHAVTIMIFFPPEKNLKTGFPIMTA